MREHGFVTVRAVVLMVAVCARFFTGILNIALMGGNPCPVEFASISLDLFHMTKTAFVGGLLPIMTCDAGRHRGVMQKIRSGAMNYILVAIYTLDTHCKVLLMSDLKRVINHQLRGLFMALCAIDVGNMAFDLSRLHPPEVYIYLFETFCLMNHHILCAR